MTQISEKRAPRRGRLFPEYTIPPEDLARRQAERDARYQQARTVFERVRSEAIADRYNWFIVIEPNSGDYFIDADEEIAARQACQKYPDARLVTFRINETGACGMI